jgi:hypothetical protein
MTDSLDADRAVALVVLALLDSVLSRCPEGVAITVPARRAVVLRDVLLSHPAPLCDVTFLHRARQISREMAALLDASSMEGDWQSREMLELVSCLLSPGGAVLRSRAPKS